MLENKQYFKDGKAFNLPYGFSVNFDLASWVQMKHELTKPVLSKQARLRLAWFDFYRQTSNVSLTCRRLGIPRKTFY